MVWFFIGKVEMWCWYMFFVICGDDFFCEFFDIRILYIEMENFGFLIFKIVFRILLVFKFK